MNRGIFITGTGTGVGKTVVTAGIVRWLRGRGVDAVPVKPVQTGGLSKKSGLAAPDLDFCLAAAGIKVPDATMSLMSPYIFAPACSPHLAGRIKGEYPKLAHIQTCVEALSSICDMVIVEGAGGVLVPLDEQATMLDLMKLLGFPVVLVAHTGLGTINHSLLSIRTLKSAGIEVLGVVFNEVAPGRLEDDFIKTDNIDTIARLGDVHVLGNITHLAGLDPGREDLWNRFEKDMSGRHKILKGATRK